MDDNSSDSGGIGDIVGDIAESAGDVGGAVLGELKKFGKSAGAQVTGSSDITGGLNSPKSSKVKAAPAGLDTTHSILGELKKFGQAATSQITGHEESAANLASMTKRDDEFSEKESRAVRAKIKQIYEEYSAKRASEGKQQETVAEHQEEQQKQIQEAKKKEMPRSDIQKTRAEIKNYGAE